MGQGNICKFAFLGMAKFLKAGPCKIVRQESFLKGFGSMTFILTWINIIATAGMKGLVVFFIFRPHRWDIPALILMMYVPQLVHVSYTFQNSKSAELW